MTRKLKTYQQVWTRKSLNDRDYQYRCVWSDGAETWEDTLPWGDLVEAVELPDTNLRKLYPPKPVTLDDATVDFCRMLAGTLPLVAADEAPVLQAAE